MMTREEIEATCRELLDNCNGYPNAIIAWPHRILHKAADVCREALALYDRAEKAESERDQLKADVERLREALYWICIEVPYATDHPDQYPKCINRMHKRAREALYVKPESTGADMAGVERGIDRF